MKSQRFLDLVESTGELDVTVLASSRMPKNEDKTLDCVLEFHEKFACHIEPSPKIPCITGTGNEALKEAAFLFMKGREILRAHGKEDVRCCRVALIAEETAELASAFVEHDPKSVLDAFLDIGYVVAGGVINCGLQDVYLEGMDRVHRSNMSKLGEDGKPIHDHTGKVTKGPNYKPVDLTDLVDGTWLAEQEELAKS